MMPLPRLGLGSGLEANPRSRQSLQEAVASSEAQQLLVSGKRPRDTVLALRVPGNLSAESTLVEWGREEGREEGGQKGKNEN